MIASDLQISLPLVNRLTSASVAARLVARRGTGGVVVADESGKPVAVLSSTDVLRLMVPGRFVEDAALPILDAGTSDDIWARADRHTIGDLLDDDTARATDIAHVDTDDSLLAVASKMVDSRAQIAVVDGAPQGPRFVILPTVMEAILVACGDEDVAG